MDAAPPARVVLLGGFAVELEGAEPGSTQDELPQGVRRLVAYLALSGRPVRAAVAGHLWPDVCEERALGSLRSALWRLHKVAPGLVETRFAGVLVKDDSLREHVVARTALGRYAQPDEISGAAVYLACDASSFVTGAVLVVDGGSTMTT